MSLFSSAPLVAAAGAPAGDTTTVDFMRALSQPLLIQTPCRYGSVCQPAIDTAPPLPAQGLLLLVCNWFRVTQMMLETLFFRSREQGAAVLGAQEQVCLHPQAPCQAQLMDLSKCIYAVEFAGSRERCFEG